MTDLRTDKAGCSTRLKANCAASVTANILRSGAVAVAIFNLVKETSRLLLLSL